MQRVSALAIAAVAAASLTPAQTPAAPAFDAASIKPAEEGARGGRGGGMGLPLLSNNIQTSPGSLTVRALNLKGIVAWAYHVLPVQVAGPDSMDYQRFDIVAHTPGATDSDGIRAMLRTLLETRFHMEAHRETKEMAAYVLSVAKGGVKFQESAADGEASIVPNQKTFSVNVERTPVSSLIELLTMFFRAPILDETDLKGKYDIKLNIAKYINGAGGGIETDPQTMIVQILQNDLGLKLEPKKAEVEMVVVDKVDKTPTAN